MNDDAAATEAALTDDDDGAVDEDKEALSWWLPKLFLAESGWLWPGFPRL